MAECTVEMYKIKLRREETAQKLTEEEDAERVRLALVVWKESGKFSGFIFLVFDLKTLISNSFNKLCYVIISLLYFAAFLITVIFFDFICVQNIQIYFHTEDNCNGGSIETI